MAYLENQATAIPVLLWHLGVYIDVSTAHHAEATAYGGGLRLRDSEFGDQRAIHDHLKT
jgi:hypothetical protein